MVSKYREYLINPPSQDHFIPPSLKVQLSACLDITIPNRMCDSASLPHIPCFRITIAAELQKYADKLIPICIITCVLFLL